jgi:glycosyltransferase involved in cell wall biosynthesis
MRVLIDALPLLIRSAGVKNYLYYWIQHLQRAAGSDVIQTFPSIKKLGPLTHERSVAGPWPTFRGLASLALTNHAGLPIPDWAARRADIFHVTNLLHRLPRRIKITATIYDLTTRLMPEVHTEANVRADRSFAELLRAADKLIAISASTRNDAVRLLGLRPENIEVIYPGIPAVFFNVPEEAITRVRRDYGLHKPFALFLGTIEPRKNVDTLLDAYESLSHPEFELVLAGPTGWAPGKTLERLKKYRALGYLPEPDIAPLTAAASICAYPSLYEGFGFPVAQAMAAGVPVVTSNVSSLPEVAGDAALLVDPRSTAELANALDRLMRSTELRTELAARGRKRAQDFRWEACAARSLQFFESVI